jgi:2',3'-cyclic-nucleotide 2'-phosphodiesterase (5'-nucleotidase family)
VLLLDAGNTLWSKRPLGTQTKGKVHVDAMNLLRYDAMVIGDLDLQLGPDILRQRIAEAEFPILSANVMVASEGTLLAEPCAVLEVAGRKVGIIGLTWDSAAVSQDQYTLLNADDVLAEYVAELEQQTNIIIVLSNMGYDQDTRLASLVPGTDLIVGGRTLLPLPQGWHSEETGTIVVQAGSEGKWIGRRQLLLDSAGVVTEYSDELVYLTPDYADDPEMRAFLDNYQVQ